MVDISDLMDDEENEIEFIIRDSTSQTFINFEGRLVYADELPEGVL